MADIVRALKEIGKPSDVNDLKEHLSEMNPGTVSQNVSRANQADMIKIVGKSKSSNNRTIPLYWLK